MGSVKVIINSSNDASKFYTIIRLNERKSHYEIEYNNSFVKPRDVLILTQFVIWALTNGISINISVRNQDVSQYLEDIKFFEFIMKNTTQSQTIEFISRRTAMPIRRVDRVHMHEYIIKTHEYIKGCCINKDLTMLESCLSELINNVYDHSKSPIEAYVFCQYYPNKNEITIAVTDLGIGIPTSVNQYLALQNKGGISQFDALKWAIKQNNSVKSHPQNMGKGLDTVLTFVKHNNGQIKLNTNEVQMIVETDGKLRFEDNPFNNFVGTTFEITIKVDKLPDKEDFDFDYDF